MHGESFPVPLVMVDLTDAGNEPADTAEILFYLKDVLGSVGALADAWGNAVERYVYSPYGETTILAPHARLDVPPLLQTHYHDADLNGWIDVYDESHLQGCVQASSTDMECVFVHDRNDDGIVDVMDESMFRAGYDPAGSEPPEDWRRDYSRKIRAARV